MFCRHNPESTDLTYRRSQSCFNLCKRSPIALGIEPGLPRMDRPNYPWTARPLTRSRSLTDVRHRYVAHADENQRNLGGRKSFHLVESSPTNQKPIATELEVSIRHFARLVTYRLQYPINSRADCELPVGRAGSSDSMTV